jgi:hypothetical protein
MDSERIALYIHGREKMTGLLAALLTVTSFGSVIRPLEDLNANLTAKAGSG